MLFILHILRFLEEEFATEDVQIHERAFPHMDTLTMTGNSFGDISDGLFTEGKVPPIALFLILVELNPALLFTGEVHSSLSLLNLTGNGITKISSDTFKGAPAVQFLYLNDNDIRQAGRYAFEPMQRLRVLDMTGALGRRSAASKADLISILFETEKRGFVELAELKLANNQIGKLYKDTFCKVLGLRRLDLSNNNLSYFEVAPNCLRSLEALDLSGNHFTVVRTKYSSASAQFTGLSVRFFKFPTTLWDSLESLSTLDISGNPLNCDCSMQPFSAIAKQEKYSFLNQGKTLCASPPNRAGKNLFELKEDLCKSSSWGLGTLILLVVVSAACLLVYRHYRNRIPVPPAFQFGYSGLDSDDDAVRPEFV
ncbi:unnamed protein product [Haemonchus placei]|uniref:LRRCT domain-containing protein n=1 Tax=Haemonchus placei TaxID=6290 RepID=A0A0N4VT30_HAEPC|nr:unnamed protein product [Haemonchus placei]